MPTLYLLDAYALIYRAYYALFAAPRFTSAGFNTSAIFGFCNSLQEILTKRNPSHIAVCFDPPHGRTFRHDLYPEYKANREAQPEDITASIPIIKEIIAAYNIPIFEVPGFEADDVIGTLATRAQAHELDTVMVTPDKDYEQLVTDRILQLKPSLRGSEPTMLDPEQICMKFGISSPRQVIDILALEGDSVDNIPGCPGVGPKTAQKLIAEYGSVDNMLLHATEIKGAIGKKIQLNAPQIRTSYTLATIRTDIPISPDFDALKRQPEDKKALADIFRRLEFNTFLRRLDPEDTAATTTDRMPLRGASSPANSAPSTPSLFDQPLEPTSEPVKATVVKDASDIENTDALLAAPAVAVAIRYEGDSAFAGKITEIAFAASPERTYLINFPEKPQEWVLTLLSKLFTKANLIVSNSIKSDIVLLRRLGINITAPYFDTSLAHYLISPETRLSLPSEPAEQVQAMLSVYPTLAKRIADDGLLTLADEIEFPLAAVLADMEWEGVRIDITELHNLSRQLTSELDQTQQEAYDLIGHTFNLYSPAQVGEILFGELALDPKAKRTKTGAFSTTEEILEKHRNDHPVVALILKARSLKKLLSTYINALPALADPSTGKIHTTFNQTAVATGRISSSNPNLQNIPIRTETGREIRRAFIPDPGCLLLSADYSQIELRLMAHFSGDPHLTQAFHDGLDIHRATAAKIYGKPYGEVSDDERRSAKTANFGTIYGISPFGLSQRLGIPRAQAKELIDSYFSSYPHIRRFIDEAIERARENGYAKTLMGRRRYLPDINSRNATVRSFAERNAVNAPLQGSAADIIKRAMIQIHNDINRLGLRSRMLIQVHDELIFNVYPEELAQLQQLVTDRMSHAATVAVPLEVASGAASNWLEAH